MNNLRELRTKKGVYQKDVASYLGVERTTYVKYERGDSEPSFETLCKLADYFDVSVDKILGRKTNDNFYNFENVIPLHTKKVPLLGNIACGEPIFAEEEHGEYVFTSDSIDVDFCLRAQGDSMIGARIYDGDIVFIRRQDMVDDGEIAAVLIGDGATLKRVRYDKEAEILSLYPENPKYKTMHFVGKDLEQIKILGKAVAFQSEIK